MTADQDGARSGIRNNDPAVRESFSRDASGLTMVPESVARPKSVDEAVDVVRSAMDGRIPVTPAGSQTSTTAASITDVGVLLSLSALDRILEIDPVKRIARVEAGVRLGDLNRAAASHGLFFAPDPTSEEDATVGGSVACNASGARTLRYGPTRDHVRALKVIMADGTLHDLRRRTHEKNTVGFAVAHQPVDWFVGSEGALGVVLEAELALLPLPEQVTGIWIPFATLAEAIAFVIAARDSGLLPRCLELFDDKAFAIVRNAASDAGWSPQAVALVYLEDASPEPQLEAWLELGERHGGLTDDMRVADSDASLREARRLRHAVPTAMNAAGAARRQFGGRKVSTDWAVPHQLLGVALERAANAVREHRAPEPTVYGHAGNGHPHQNFIAADADELARVYRAVEQTLHEVIALGGTVAAEHGIGKLKRQWLPLQATATELSVMRGLKQTLDPHGLMAPGNVL